jgi:hypothetical protein
MVQGRRGRHPIGEKEMTMTTHELKTLDDQLNEMVRAGRFLDAIERFYADDVDMQENGDAPTRGKAANLERERSFFGSVVDKVHEVRQLSQAVGDGVTTGEWIFDWTIGGVRAQLRQVAVRRWRGGQVVAERYYYKP